jgi:chemotaxis protein CheY-P-specific phosphatase CheC
LSKWLRRGVKISTAGFERTPLGEVSASFAADVPIVALRMPLSDQLHGHSFLAISEKSALLLCDVLLQQPEGTAGELGEIERSCLEETGNIVSSSFMNGWSQWLDMEITPGPPEYAMDLPEAVLDGLLAEQAAVSDEVFMAKTDFVTGDRRLEWVFVFVPAPSAMRLIQSSGK